MDRDPGEGWQHPAGVYRVLAPARGQVVHRQRVSACDVDPPQFRGDPPAGLVEVRDIGGGQLRTSGDQEAVEPLGRGR